eukprot:5257910-Alexandrium_andersonii.AAC.1
MCIRDRWFTARRGMPCSAHGIHFPTVRTGKADRGRSKGQKGGRPPDLSLIHISEPTRLAHI